MEFIQNTFNAFETDLFLEKVWDLPVHQDRIMKLRRYLVNVSFPLFFPASSHKQKGLGAQEVEMGREERKEGKKAEKKKKRRKKVPFSSLLLLLLFRRLNSWDFPQNDEKGEREGRGGGEEAKIKFVSPPFCTQPREGAEKWSHLGSLFAVGGGGRIRLWKEEEEDGWLGPSLFIAFASREVGEAPVVSLL